MRRSLLGFDRLLSALKQPTHKKTDTHTDREMSAWCHEQALFFGHENLANKVSVSWNPHMRSTAGRAKWPACEIELNPKLKEFGDEEIQRTLKHEFAHLLAYERNKYRRIEPHGREWRTACADLKIPHERVCHTLPLTKRSLKRKFAYSCPSCGAIIYRVREIRRPVACLSCCRTYNHGRYHDRFRLIRTQLAP
jgi:SprT protein